MGDEIKYPDFELVKIIGNACLRHNDSGEASVSKQARVILDELEKAGFEVLRKKEKSQKRKNLPTEEEVFYNLVVKLITNFFLKNPNFEGQYFGNQDKHEFRDSVKEGAKYVLSEIENTKHLILWQTPEDFNRRNICVTCNQLAAGVKFRKTPKHTCGL